MGLFGFFVTAIDYIAPDHEAVKQAGEAGTSHSKYHRMIVVISLLFGALGIAGGICVSMLAAKERGPGADPRIVFLAPVIGCVFGILFGVAWSCCFAPRDFLTGPVGQKWMTLIGTKSVAVARVVCLILGLMLSAPIVVCTWLAITGK